jgi:hypothetical protein
MSMLVALTNDPDASEEVKAEARQEILVIVGATTGRYDVYQQWRARRHLHAVIEAMNAPPEPTSTRSPVVTLAERRRRARGKS